LISTKKEEVLMADAPVVHLGDPKEQVAFKLLQLIAFSEKKAIAVGFGGSHPTKEWILDTYAECLEAVKHGMARTKT
jgi:hypothetical protein